MLNFEGLNKDNQSLLHFTRLYRWRKKDTFILWLEKASVHDKCCHIDPYSTGLNVSRGQ